MSEGMQWEIHDLWNRHYEERDRIIREEMDKDQDEYPGIFIFLAVQLVTINVFIFLHTSYKFHFLPCAFL